MRPTQVRSVEKGLGSTFYEYNELVIQYGCADPLCSSASPSCWSSCSHTPPHLLCSTPHRYLVMFSLVHPGAILLALLNNLIEVRTDAYKILIASRRVRAEPSVDIGPWKKLTRLLSVCGILINLAYLLITSDFFEQLTLSAPLFGEIWFRRRPTHTVHYPDRAPSPRRTADRVRRVWLQAASPLPLPHLPHRFRVLFVFALEHLLLAAYFLVDWLVPDVR